MKRKILHAATIALIGCGVVLLNGCNKKDTTPPVVTINGASTVHVSLNSRYYDQGASATDKVDLTDEVATDYSGTNPNVNLAGTYIIHYSAVDNAGNTGTAMRTVIVANDAQNIAGTYNVTDNIVGNNTGNTGSYTYTVSVTPSATLNNQLLLNNFSSLGATVTVTAIVVGDTTITIAPAGQRPSGMRISGTIDGNGTIGPSNNITGFNYTVVYNVGSDNGVSVWTKQ